MLRPELGEVLPRAVGQDDCQLLVTQPDCRISDLGETGLKPAVELRAMLPAWGGGQAVRQRTAPIARSPLTKTGKVGRAFARGQGRILKRH